MRLLFSSLLILITTLAIAQKDIQQAIDQFVNDPSLAHASVGVAVIDIESGTVLGAHDPDRTLVPASTLKVLATATALKVLGKDFRYQTELQYTGQIVDGTLNGHIIIKGYGDPTLGSDHFDETADMKQVLATWVSIIQKAGIRNINGAIIGDASFFGTEQLGSTWLWEDTGNYYATGVWGLNFQENRYFIQFRQTPTLGAKPKIEKIEPYIPNLILLNEVVSDVKGSGDQAYIFGGPYNYTRYIRGTIPIGKGLFTVKGGVPDPPFFAAFMLAEALKKAGISASEAPTSYFEWTRRGNTLPTKRSVLHTHQSPPLSVIVKEANLKSVNLYCEAFVRSIGYEKTGQATLQAGLDAITEYLKILDVGTDGLYISDGSGLSVRNGITARQLATFMQQVKKDPAISDLFYDSLPVAARSGTLRYMFKNTRSAGLLRAKSGGMTRVRSYTGYTKTSSGKPIAFALIANNFTGKSSAIRQKMQNLMNRFK